MLHASSPARFAGVVPPVATPLNADGTIDFDSLRNVVEYLISEGVDGLFALGSTGETAYFTDEQRVSIAKAIVEAAAGRVPIIAGAIELTAARVVRLAQQLERVGVDAVVITAPLYTLNSEAEIAAHFRTVAHGISIPLWAYDVPVRVHTKLSVALLMQLAGEGVIHGVKDSSGDDVSFRRLLAANAEAGHPLQLLTGHEVVVDAMALAGADGVVPGLANVEAGGYVRLWRAATQGDWEGARREQQRLNEVFSIVFQPSGLSGDATGVGAFKAAMKARGIIATATMADGVQSLSDDAVTKISVILDSLDLLPASV